MNEDMNRGRDSRRIYSSPKNDKILNNIAKQLGLNSLNNVDVGGIALHSFGTRQNVIDRRIFQLNNRVELSLFMERNVPDAERWKETNKYFIITYMTPGKIEGIPRKYQGYNVHLKRIR